jgi:PAS domain S-box-containing protein
MAELQNRLAEAENTLEAIRSGAVDALVVNTPAGEQVFTLKGADETYRALVEAMSEGAVTLKNGVISYCNLCFAKMAGAPMENIFGASIFDFVPGENFRRLVDRLQKGAATRGTVEAVLRTAGGREIPVLLSGSRFLSEDRMAVGLVITDIAERKEAERVRQELSRSILTGQEQERQRVARDLHDSVNQLLVSAKYRLHGLSAQTKTPPNSSGIQQVHGLVEKAIAEVRLISRNLRPSELDDLGLEPALKSLAREFQDRSGIVTHFRALGRPTRRPLAKELEMTLYRIAQESLNNVEKHSRASRVELALNRSRARIGLTVRDNGRGFVRGDGGGSGLQNMTERAAMFRGRVLITSISGVGTKITVTIPLGHA